MSIIDNPFVNKIMESSTEFKCDKLTVAAVRNHLRFLKQVADNPFIHFTNALRNAIR